MSLNPFRLIRESAISIKGNARYVVFLEPLFVIPHAMLSSFMTLYMLELGMDAKQVGLITSIGLGVSVFFALISGYITDRIGRRNATTVFDAIGWGGAFFIWAIARNFYFFVAAAAINAFFRIAMNSWNCLMLEDSLPEVRVHIFNFLFITGVLGGFSAPLGALLVNKMTLVPAMRLMLFISLAFASLLFIIRHRRTTETVIGAQIMESMKGVKASESFREYLPVLKRMSGDRALILAFLLRVLNFIQFTVRNTFLAVLVTARLGFPAEVMALLATINSFVMMAAMVFITPLLSRYTRNWPISLGCGFHIVATVILLLSPPSQSYVLLVTAGVFIALGSAILSPRIDALVANAINNEERSVANSAMFVIMLFISMPFGYIAGVLSGIDQRLPFIMTLTILLLCLGVVRVSQKPKREPASS